MKRTLIVLYCFCPVAVVWLGFWTWWYFEITTKDWFHIPLFITFALAIVISVMLAADRIGKELSCNEQR